MSDERRDDDPRETRGAAEIRDETASEAMRASAAGPPENDPLDPSDDPSEETSDDSDDPADGPGAVFEEVSLRQGPHAGTVGGVPVPKGFLGETSDRGAQERDPRYLRVDPHLATPRLRPATLGEHPGFGLLMVIHGKGGELLESDGTWRAEAGGPDGDGVRAALPVGTTTTFVGTRVEGRQRDHEERVRAQVVVRGHGTYHDDEGRPLILVNFVLAEEG